MSKPRAKTRYGIFSVGRNKTSPARAASTKRASMRRSVVRVEASIGELHFECAGDAEGKTTGLESTPEVVDRK